DIFIAQAIARLPQRYQVGDHDVRTGGQLAHHLLATRVLEVDAQTLLAPIQQLHDRIQAPCIRDNAARRYIDTAERVSGLGVLDLDAPRAQISQYRARRGRGHPVGDFQDLDPVQQSRHKAPFMPLTRRRTPVYELPARHLAEECYTPR